MGITIFGIIQYYKRKYNSLFGFWLVYILLFKWGELYQGCFIIGFIG